MHPRRTWLAIAGLTAALLLPGLALLSGDFTPPGLRGSPTWPLHLQWVRSLPPLEPTWPDQPRFTSDAAFTPVVAGDFVLATSSRHDCVDAFDGDTGEARWRFVADGPVRFAPTVWKEYVYVVSDDGYLYCLDLPTGDVVWKFRGGPGDRHVLGNERLISTWPARGGPVVADEGDDRATVYFGAGIWPFMGIFLHALDADTGAVRWQNSAEGSIYVKQPHQTDAFAGVAPQGSLVVTGDRLLVPGGRSIPACFDRHTGKRLHYRLADDSKLGGGPDLAAGHDVYLSGPGGFDVKNGDYLGQVGEPYTIDGTTLYSIKGTSCRAFDLASRPPLDPKPDPKDKKAQDRAKAKLASEAWLGDPLGSTRVPTTTVLLAAHDRLYGAGPGLVYAVELPLSKRAPLVWTAPVSGRPLHLTASDDQLFVSTLEGQLYAFGRELEQPVKYPLRTTPLPGGTAEEGQRARQILDATQVREGYGVVFGAGGLARELVKQSRLRFVMVEPDQHRVDVLREELTAAGVPGTRASVLCATPQTANLPPYLASLVVTEEAEGQDAAFCDLVCSILRPHGGVACFAPAQRANLSTLQVRRATELRLEDRDGLVLLRRDGALPGAADWTHQHADAANTRVSRDAVVKAPLGLLWFGGPGHQGILPRHGHGPVPQVCQGRLFIEGTDSLRAIDIYTGRLLWETRLPGLGKVYDNQAHQPGANGIGSNYVSTPDGVFVAYKAACVRLDPVSGKSMQRYQLPRMPRQRSAPDWTFVSVAGDYLIGGAAAAGPAPKGGPPNSKRLTVLDRLTGKVLWSIDAKAGFRHNAICVGGGRLYAIDIATANEFKKGKDRQPGKGRLVVHDLRSGKLLWSSERDVFGTWLSYSAKHDIVVEAGLCARDTLGDEPEGMRAYRASDGHVLWHQPEYFGPALLHGDRVLKGGDARAGSGTACDIRTGKPVTVPDPLTGAETEWKWLRTYGCNTPAASEHLMVFRSGAAGFFDLCNDGGTGNLGGFRSSCTLNLIPAGGVLTAPDYTRTCTCSYQNQCSLGFVHMPEAELWTFTTSRAVKGPIRRVGVNLGAPGSRKSADGTLWLEYPPAGGPSPKVTVTTTPASPETFRLHASQVEGDGLKWVAASGVRGLTRLTVTLGKGKGERRYRVRLYFLEPDAVAVGDRVFDVSVQGKRVLERFDVLREAGGRGRAVVRECRDVAVRDALTIGLEARAGVPVLSGVEVVPEGAVEVAGKKPLPGDGAGGWRWSAGVPAVGGYRAAAFASRSLR